MHIPQPAWHAWIYFAKNQIQNKYKDSREGKAQISKGISSNQQIRENKQMSFIVDLLL